MRVRALHSSVSYLVLFVFHLRPSPGERLLHLVHHARHSPSGRRPGLLLPPDRPVPRAVAARRAPAAVLLRLRRRRLSQFGRLQGGREPAHGTGVDGGRRRRRRRGRHVAA